MQTFFGLDTAANEGTVTGSIWPYLKSGLKSNLDMVVSYYRRATGSVDGSHFLIKLIYSVGVSRSLPVDRFYANCVSRTMAVATANKMTCSVNNGQGFDGVFYGSGVSEVIVATDEDFDYDDAQINWKDLQPVTVLKHPKSDLNLNLPDGTKTSNEKGIAVIAINIPMLALQYRQWKYEEDALAIRTGNSPRGAVHYIYNYVLTGMLSSHLDCAVFNRAYNLLNGIPFGESKVKHPFYMTDFTKRLNDFQMGQLDLLRGSMKKFNSLLKMIPLVTENTLADFAKLPDVAPTRQVIWSLALSRLAILSFLFKVTKLRPRQINSAEVNHILWKLSLYKTERAIKSVLPDAAYVDAKYDLDVLLEEA